MSTRKLTIFAFLAIIGLIFYGACGSTTMGKKVAINGVIEGAANLQILLEKVNGDNTTTPISKTECDSKGAFELMIEEGLSEGIYLFKVGAKQFMAIFDGTEKKMNITGNINNIDRFQYQIEGSETCKVYVNTLSRVINQQIQMDELKDIVKNTPNSIVGMQVALQGIGPSTETMTLIKEAQARVQKEKPDNDLNLLYTNVMAQFDQQVAQQRSADKIQVGQLAPDIAMQDPKGKTYKLSDLKGKVVLLDFWAAWCGPCRRANPHVVETYHKYKDKGFTVFSVSLDGLDEATRSRMLSDPAQLKVQEDNQRQKWVDAIEKDKLVWPYHVSDLKKWDCAPAKEYGVRGIPRTFLIDREGKIAVVNPRDLESALLEIL
jgi:peroxiredoxin